MTDSVVAVGQVPAEIPLPPVASVLVLNSSEGIGEAKNSPNVVVDNSASCSLSPQVGCRLSPGETVTMPLLSTPYENQLPLYAVADGPGAQLTVVLFQ